MKVGQALRRARETALLSVDTLSAWAGVDAVELGRFEEGHLSLHLSDVDRCACVLGLRMEDLESDDRSDPLPLMLRSSADGAFDLKSEVSSVEILRALGEFQRTVRNIDALEQRLGHARKSLPKIDGVTKEYGGRRGEILADRTREELGLGLEPIASMRDLVEARLGISVVWVTSDHLDQNMDGASTSFPKPSILVNVIEPNTLPWRVRITLAHELCHVLFDHRARQTLLSPAQPTGALQELETVARAYAACLLAPTEGVKSTVGSVDPTSEEAICLVGEKYGVGRKVVINRLGRVFKLKEDTHRAMTDRSPMRYAANFSGDRVEEVDGFRGDPLRSLVGRALKEQLLRPAQARRLLGLSGAEALPFAGLGALAEPTVSRAECARRAAQARLRELFSESDLEAASVSPQDDFFRVAIVSGGIGSANPQTRGHIDVSGTGVILAMQLS